MFHVLTVLNDFRQISLLNPGFLGDLAERLRHFAQARGGREEREPGGKFFFAFNSDRDKAVALVSEFLFLVRDHLMLNQEELRGFSLVVEKSSDPVVNVQKRLRNLYLLTERPNGVWTTEATALELKSVLPLENRGALWEILGPAKNPTDSKAEWQTSVESLSWGQDLSVLKSSTPAPWRLCLRTDHPEALGFFLGWFKACLPDNPLPVVLSVSGATRFPLFPLTFGLSERWLASLVAQGDPDAREAWEHHPEWIRLLGPTVLGSPCDHLQEELLGAWTLTLQTLGAQPVPTLVAVFPSDWEIQALEVFQQLLRTAPRPLSFSLVILEHPGKPLDWTGMTFIEKNWSTLSPVSPFTGPALLELLSKGGHPEQHFGEVLKHRDPRDTKILTLISMTGGLVDGEFLLSVLEGAGEDPLVMADKLELLIDAGLVHCEGGLSLVNPRWARVLLLGAEERQKLVQALGERLGKYWKARHKPWPDGFALLLADCGRYKEALECLEYYLELQVTRDEEFQWVGKHPAFLKAPSPWAGVFKLAFEASRYRRCLNKGLTSLPAEPENFTHSGEWQLQSGRDKVRNGELQAGFMLIKQAYMLSQSNDNPSLKIRCGLELGLALIKKGKVTEAWEYFEMSARTAEAFDLPRLLVLSRLYESVARMLWGNLTAAREGLEGLEGLVQRYSLQSWDVLRQFYLGRIAFDLGQYTEAQKKFAAGAEGARRAQVEDNARVCRLWSGRALAYGGLVREAVGVLSVEKAGPERDFFLAEALYFKGDEAGALEILEAVDPVVLDFQSTEALLWSTGFSPLEDLALPGTEREPVLQTMIQGFRAFIRGRLGTPETGSSELLELISHRSGGDCHPYHHIFHYWWICLMPLGRASLDAHHSTILGRGLKDLQTRGSRITGRDDRYAYLQSSYWNAAYIGEGKKFKLA